MKKLIIIATTLLLSAAVTAQVRVSNFAVRQNGAAAEVSFDAQVDRKATKSSYKLIMTPVVYSGNQYVELAPIVVETRKTRILDSRTGVQPIPNATLTENGRIVRYTTVIANRDWLSPDSDLRFNLLSVGCCEERALNPLAVATKAAPPPPQFVAPPPPQYVAPPPPPPATDERTVRVGGMIFILDKNAQIYPLTGDITTARTQNRLEIGFAVNSSRLNLFAFNNNRVMNEILTTLRSSRDAQARIEITGYASPEGPQANNYRLAQNRALAVRNHILDNIPILRPANFEIVNGGENWEGLYRLVEQSAMPGRWQVLDIIETTPPDIDYFTNTSRKQMLMNLNGGVTWRYMLANFFPRLRSAATVTVYTPMAPGSSGAAGAMPPARNTEIINRAIDLLGERNSDQALTMLLEIENDPRTWNPLGVAYLLEYNTNRAREYFQKAADRGYSEARANLEQLNRNN